MKKVYRSSRLIDWDNIEKIVLMWDRRNIFNKKNQQNKII